MKKRGGSGGVLGLLESRELRRGGDKNLDHLLSNSLVSLAHGFPYRSEIRGNFSCVNAVTLSDNGNWLFTGGDDTNVRLYSLSEDPTKLKPAKSFPGHQSNVFAIAASSDAKRFWSCGNDGMLISQNVERGLGDVSFAHDEGVLSISLSPGDEHELLSAGHDGAVKLWDVRQNAQVGQMDFNHEMNSVAFSPTAPHVFAAAGNKSDVALYDARMCFTGVSKRERTLVKFNLKLSAQERFVRFLDVTNVAFSPSGRHVVATVSRWLPTIYDIGGPLPVCVLDHRTGPDEPETAPRYRNSVTVKTCKVSSYGGKDYFLSGSDDFSGFLWELPRSFAQLDESSLSEVGFSHEAGLLHPPIIRRANHVLLGARSITNSVLLHPTLPWAFTAGVEKVVRLHSAVPLDDKPAEPNPPKRISLVADPEGRRRVLRDIIVGDGMVEESVTADGEDERSLGFFDMLVHRESREQREGAIGSTPLVEGLLLPFGNEPDSYDEGEDACDDSDSTSDDDELDTDLEALLVEAQQAEAAAQGAADEDMGEADELRENEAGEADEGDVGEERIEKDADDETRGVKRRRSSSDS